MKIFLMVFHLCMLSTYAMNAQAIIALLFGKKISNDKVEMGLHLAAQGYGLTNGQGKMDVGLSIGAYTDVKLSPKFTLSNYFMFKSPKGAQDVSSEYRLFQPDTAVIGAAFSRKITYMEITPLLRYHFSPGFSLALGPYFAYRTGAKDKYEQEISGGDLSFVYKVKSSITNADLGASFDIQYRFADGKGLKLNLRFSQGFINIYKDSVPYEAFNYTVDLGVGIPIVAKDKEQ